MQLSVFLTVILIVAHGASAVERTVSSSTLGKKMKEQTPVPLSSCENDTDFHHFFMGRNRSCKMIRFLNDEERQSLCQNHDVREACPQSCGSCCEDTPGYTFTSNAGIPRGCDWLTSMTQGDSDRPSRQNEYCDQYLDNHIVRDRCPVSCDFCFSPTANGSRRKPPSPYVTLE
mmetsp:Transcript_10702/g.16240  ORF Transcript_10702/g.16240 Transcript_10702/m.16240 type:complete len:173 (-) Transcript_10702:322-840(-)